MSDPSIAGRLYAIAGATGGLGRHVARALGAAGASVALADRDEPRLADLVRELGLPSSRCDARVVDLLDQDETRAWAAALGERFGEVSGLVHLVGGWRGGEPLESAPLEDWDVLHALLVRTVQHTTRAFASPLRASGHGRYVLVSSTQAQQPSHTNAAYAAAKAAAETWTLALADGFREAGGRATANIVVVEAIATPEMRAEHEDGDDAMRTFTDAEDIAAAITAVCGDAASAMNGQRVALHGGSRR
jgi:NAD(P)-dependent dehydrogenase (short-subunit alcohol dehydrogenase family)